MASLDHCGETDGLGHGTGEVPDEPFRPLLSGILHELPQQLEAMQAALVREANS